MLDYIIITKQQVNNCDDPELIVKEQQEKMEVLGIDDGIYLCKFFNSITGETYSSTTIDNAIQSLSIKEGYDLVQFNNGNYGFVSYYGNYLNGFEIIDREV